MEKRIIDANATENDVFEKNIRQMIENSIRSTPDLGENENETPDLDVLFEATEVLLYKNNDVTYINASDDSSMAKIMNLNDERQLY